MPTYKNPTHKWLGEENLTIPPATNNYGSEYYYNLPNMIVDENSPPFYNPIKQQEYIDFNPINVDSTIHLNFDYSLIGKDFFLHITCIKHIINKLNDIEIYFNSLTNTPPLFMSNGIFCINNTNRIKRLFIVIKQGIKCELLIMITDKYLIGASGIPYSNNVNTYKV